MADADLKRAPKTLAPEAWFYETEKGLEVIVQHFDGSGNYHGTGSYVIPWNKVRSALKRKDRPAVEGEIA